MTYLVADDLPTVPAGERFRALLARPGILRMPGAHNGQAALQAGALTATNVTGLTSSTSLSIVVADAPLSAAGRTIISTRVFSGAVASFTDADPAGALADYSATISWGDGTTSPGTVAASGSSFSVTGSHTFAASALGPQTITVTICDAGGSCATATSQALIFTYTTGGSFVVGDSSAGGLTAGAIGTERTLYLLDRGSAGALPPNVARTTA